MGLTRAVRGGDACAHAGSYYVGYWVTSFSLPNWNGLALLFIAAAEQTCPSVILGELQGV